MYVPIEGIDPFPARGYGDPAATVQRKEETMKIVAAVSMAQLLVHVATARKAVRDQVPYDTPFGRGKPENVARDMWNPTLGSGMAAPWPVLAAQAIGTLMLFGKPRPWVGRALGWMGLSYVYGYLSERSVRASFRHPDMNTTPLTVLGTVLSIAMALSGLARRERPSGTR